MYTPVRVVWLDSSFEVGWHYTVGERAPLEPVVTIGFVSHVTDTALEITSTLGVKRGGLNPLQIPWGSIQKLDNLAKLLLDKNAFSVSLDEVPVTVPGAE